LGNSSCVHFWLLFLILRISGFSPFSRISRSGWFLFCLVCRCDAALNQLVTSVVDSTLQIPTVCNQLVGTVFQSCCFPYKLVSFKVGAHTPATAAEDSPAQPPHVLAKYTQEPWLYPPPPLTKERSSVGRAQALHGLASCWCPFPIHSGSNVCIRA